jgi:hypothetical protein
VEPAQRASPAEDAASHGSPVVARITSLAVTAGQIVSQRRVLYGAVAAGRQDDPATQALWRQEKVLRWAYGMWWASAHDPRWLARADVLSIAYAWGSAAAFADTERSAASALRKCEDRLRVLHPYAMAHYDRLRADGSAPPDAMRDTAPLFSRHLHPRTGEPRVPRPALAEGPVTDVSPAGLTSGPAGPADQVLDKENKMRPDSADSRTHARSKPAPAPPDGPGEPGLAAETVTSLPEGLITTTSGQASAGTSRSSTQVATEGFPRSAANAVLAAASGPAEKAAAQTPVRAQNVTAQPGQRK